MQRVQVKGPDLLNFLNFYEEEQENGKYKEVVHHEIVRFQDDTASADIVSIILSGATSMISTLILDYINRYKNNEITFDIENDSGGKMTVTIKNMSIEEVKQAMKEFSDN